MIKHSVLLALFAKAQDVDPVTANFTANASVNASVNATANASVTATVVELSPDEKISAFENSISDVFMQYGLSDEMTKQRELP